MGWKDFALNNLPLLGVKRREKGITWMSPIHSCEIHPGGEWESLAVNVSPANHHNLGSLGEKSCQSQCLFPGPSNVNARTLKKRATQDDVPSVWKWLSNRLIGLTAHDNALPKGELLEPFQVPRSIPARKRAVVPNYPIIVCRHNQAYFLSLHRTLKQVHRKGFSFFLPYW